MNAHSILVPRISTFPAHEAKARAILRWLSKRDIVEALPTTCAGGANGMAYAIGVGARHVVEFPQHLPYGQAVNGLEIITRRCIYTPTEGFLGEAGCPQCRQEVGEPLFDSLEVWWPGETDNFMCPECGHEDDINGFLFLQPCGFSDLGFIFNNWGAARFRQGFIDEFAERLGYPIALLSTR